MRFGDGVIMEGADITHAYTHARAFKARLEATGFASKPDIQTFSIAIITVATKYLTESRRRFVEGKQ